ncbi:uncharacterized protein LY89DRAFT_558296, partial [Mollisia scopiformis]
ALQHLRLKSVVRVLWIDALCINQSSVEERNNQVCIIMARVYKQAVCVVAWLGRLQKTVPT